MNKHTVMIAMPMTGMVSSHFFGNFLKIQTQGMAKIGIEINSLVYDARNNLVMKAIDQECDYILWLDSDMTFEPDVMLRLLEDVDEYGYDFVCGLYFKRTFPTDPLIIKHLEWSVDPKTNEITHEADLYLDYPKDSVFEIAGCGFGCVMTKTQLFVDIANAFRQNPFDPLPMLGEDYSLCWRIAQTGRKMYCDSRVKLGHIGHYVFDEETWLMNNEDPHV